MKAWICREKNGEDYATVVFAETRGKARAIAQNTDACEDVDFIDIEVYRARTMDKHYRGKVEMDWYDEDDRIALVKDGGFRCTYELSTEELECEACPAKEWCERYSNKEVIYD